MCTVMAAFWQSSLRQDAHFDGCLPAPCIWTSLHQWLAIRPLSDEAAGSVTACVCHISSDFQGHPGGKQTGHSSGDCCERRGR